jgi:hypothetical protein
MGHLWGRRAAGGQDSSELDFGNGFSASKTGADAQETTHCFRNRYYAQPTEKLYKRKHFTGKNMFPGGQVSDRLILYNSWVPHISILRCGEART